MDFRVHLNASNADKAITCMIFQINIVIHVTLNVELVQLKMIVPLVDPTDRAPLLVTVIQAFTLDHMENALNVKTNAILAPMDIPVQCVSLELEGQLPIVSVNPDIMKQILSTVKNVDIFV